MKHVPRGVIMLGAFLALVGFLYLAAPPPIMAVKYGDEIQITEDTYDQSLPDVAYDTVNNRYLVVWTDSNDGQIWGKFVNPDGSQLAAFAISSSSGMATQPKIAFDNMSATKRFLVVWTDTRDGVGRIYGQFVGIAGTLDPDGSNFRVSRTANETITYTFPLGQTATRTVTYQSQEKPSIVFNAVTKKFVVSWLDTTDLEQNYAYRPERVCSNVVQFEFSYFPASFADGSVVRYRDATYADAITGPKADGSALSSTVVSQSRFVFRSAGFEPTSVCGQFSEKLTVEARYNIMNNESSPILSYKPTTGDIYTVWSARALDGKATASWARECVQKNADETACKTVAVDGVDGWGPYTQTGPVFEETADDAVPVIYGRHVSEIGDTRRVDDLILSDNTKPSYNPTIALDKDAFRWLTVWETQEDGEAGKNLYGQLIDMQNYQFYGSRATVSSEPSDQTSPRASYEPVQQRYFVVWEDARSQEASLSNIDIFGQFVDPQGQLSGSNFPVTVAKGNQEQPTLSFGDFDARRFLIVWKDGRTPGAADIYGQLWEYSVAPQLLITDETNTPIYNQNLDFGSVNVGSTSEKVFRIWNLGNAQLSIVPDSNTGVTDPASPFELRTAKPSTISPGIYYEMRVQFAPVAGGGYSGDPTNSYKINISSNGGSTVLYLSGIGTNQGALSIDTISLPDGNIGVAYSQTLAAGGGVNPYTWSITGSLPPGLALTQPTNENYAVVSGNPTTGGTYNFTVRVTDNQGSYAERPLSITVTSVRITTTSLQSWTQDVAGYAQTLAATGTAPYTWSVRAGSGQLPTGLTLTGATGAISGTPTAVSYTHLTLPTIYSV
jgi:hypothetical protein